MSDELDKYTEEELAHLTTPDPVPQPSETDSITFPDTSSIPAEPVSLPAELDAGDSLDVQDAHGWKKTSDGLRWQTEPYVDGIRVHVMTLDGRTLNVTASTEKIGREKIRNFLRAEHS